MSCKGLTLSQKVEGEIFAYDKAAGVVVLQRPSAQQRCTLQFLNEIYIQVRNCLHLGPGMSNWDASRASAELEYPMTFQELEEIKPPLGPVSFSLPALNLEEMRKRAERKIQVRCYAVCSSCSPPSSAPPWWSTEVTDVLMLPWFYFWCISSLLPEEQNTCCYCVKDVVY